MRTVWRTAAGAAAAVMTLPTFAFSAAKPHTEVNWAARPTAAELAAARQKIFATGATAGRVVMRCGVEDDGALSACRIVQETPQGSGYGKAILELAPKFRRTPPGKDGLREVNVVDGWSRWDTPPDWVKRPTPEQLLAVFPKAALARGVGGQAVVNCRLGTQGSLFDCVPTEESPAGMGFGAAGVALTPQFAMRPARLNGQPVPSDLTIPINWRGAPTGTDGLRTKAVAPPDLLWIEAPSYADVAAAYPKKAREAKIGGHATLSCDMNQEGRLRACDVIASEPKSYGFEAAAKALTAKFRLEVGTEEERKVARALSVHLPVTFDPAMLGDSPPQIGKPKWAQLPTSEQMTSAFGNLKVAGAARTVLSCRVQPGGAVNDCRVMSEDPAGSGIGAAAMALTPNFRLSTWTAEGLPTIGGVVRIPLRYEGSVPAASAPARPGG